MILATEKDLLDTKNQIKALNRQARLATNLEVQHEIQEKVRKLEKKKCRQRQQIFDLEDEITEKRDDLIQLLDQRLAQKTAAEPVFTIWWTVN